MSITSGFTYFHSTVQNVIIRSLTGLVVTLEKKLGERQGEVGGERDGKREGGERRRGRGGRGRDKYKFTQVRHAQYYDHHIYEG